MSETCCTQLSGNAGPKKPPKNATFGHHRTTLLDYIFATKAHIDNRKKICYAAICPPDATTIWWSTSVY